MTDPVRRALELLAAGYPAMKLTEATIAVWRMALDGYSEAEIRRGVGMLAKHHTHGAPAPAHLVEAIEGRIVSRRLPRMVEGVQVITHGQPQFDYGYVREWPDGSTAEVPQDELDALTSAQRERLEGEKPKELQA